MKIERVPCDTFGLKRHRFRATWTSKTGVDHKIYSWSFDEKNPFDEQETRRMFQKMVDEALDQHPEKTEYKPGDKFDAEFELVRPLGDPEVWQGQELRNHRGHLWICRPSGVNEDYTYTTMLVLVTEIKTWK